jgi:putative copper resistance protein D
MRFKRNKFEREIMLASIVAIVMALFLVWNPSAFAQQSQPQSTPDMQDMPGMDMQHSTAEETPAMAAKQARDKRESEFNHHLAGLLVALAGAFLLTQDKLAKRWPAVRYVWPCCFLAAGIFLAVFSDTEIWPFGNQSLWFAITHNPEDLEHKTFAVILLALGTIELLRARGRLHSLWSKWAFPVVGMIGAVMLLFHHHTAGMHGAHHMETMEHIQNQHRAFAAAGGGIALTKGLAEVQTTWRQAFQKMWPALLIVLGVLLMMYTE